MILGYIKKLWNGRSVVIDKPDVGYVQVEYTCDETTCVNKKKIHTSRYSSMVDMNKWNNINHQMCRSCRTRKSEKYVKNALITYDLIVDNLKREKYIIITTKKEFENSLRPSATQLNVICSNGHKHNISWNNWKNKNRRCGQCEKEKRYNNAVKYKEGYIEYRFLVDQETRKTYKAYKQIIDPNNIGRSYKYHLDHKYSIYQGFIDNIDPKIIGSIHNLQMLSFDTNISKGSDCSITKEKLIDECLGKN